MGSNAWWSELDALAAESARSPFDAVVVGAGSAGLTAARTLAEHGKRVALLEAGPASFLTHLTNTEVRFSPELTRGMRATVQYSPKLPTGEDFGPNYSCLGGRGLFWNGSAPRFRDHDFSGWPFGAPGLAGYYEWAEAEFRVTDRLGRTELGARMIGMLSAAGFDARPGPFAVDLEELGNGRLSAGIASGLGSFLRAASRHIASGRICLAVRSQVLRVLLSGSRARGVLAVPAAGTGGHEIIARSVVLAGGGVESIRLALLSNIPDPHGLVGQGIQDHIFYRCYFDGPDIYDGDRRDTAVIQIPSSSQHTEQWEIQAPGRLLFTMDDPFVWRPAPTPSYQIMIRSFGPTEKRPSNHVTVQEGPLGSATVHLQYSDADRALMERMQKRALEVGRALRLTLAEAVFSPPGSSYHEAGGLDMGTDPRSSVTDPDGRFHAVPNLVCADAAAFPHIGATNPHLTIVAESRRRSIALAAALAIDPSNCLEERAMSTELPVGPRSTRVFAGYKLPSLDRDHFYKELGATFMPGTPYMQAPMGLNAYVPAVLDIEHLSSHLAPGLAERLPDEVALIVYASLEIYNVAREKSLRRRIYTHSHTAVFDMASPRGGGLFPGGLDEPTASGDWRSWYLFDRAVDWQAGCAQLAFAVANRVGGGSPDGFQRHAADLREPLEVAGVHQAICLASEHCAFVWTRTDAELNLDSLDLFGEGYPSVLRRLVARPVSMPVLEEDMATGVTIDGIEIDGASMYMFRFQRDTRFHHSRPGHVPGNP